jgi:hypothetical protein
MNTKHLTTSENEKKRLEEKKALIIEDRQKIPRINGELIVSRAFGDP